MAEAGREPLIVVADDDAVTRYVVRETLIHEGFAVVEAANGRDALETCRTTNAELLLLDVEMPGLNGYDTCRALRATESGAPLPVVMVTSHDDRDSIDSAYEAGATDFISKPISWPLLGYRLRYILRGARNLRTLGDALAENRALMAALPDNLFVLDERGTIVEHLRGDAAPDSGDLRPWVGCDLSELFPGRAASRARRCMAEVAASGRHAAFEYRADGTGADSRWHECRFVPHDAGRVLTIVRDVSERKLAERRIHRLAFYDSLTGLPNRPQFRDRTAAALQAGTGRVALFAIDLDRFKRINDTLGSRVGDQALVTVGRRLRRELGSLPGGAADEDACLACFGGNVFSLMLRGPSAAPDLRGIAAQLGRCIARPMTVDGHEFVLTASIGVACSPDHGASVDVLLKNAESARSAAKAQGNDNQRVYRNSMTDCSAGRIDLENELRRALRQDELAVHYQPKFATRSGAIVGAEALLRWRHPQRGEIRPDVFIPLAEEAGLVCELGRWAMNRVCQQIAAWRYLGADVPPVAINLSGQEFVRGGPYEAVTAAVRRAGIRPADIELEITETVLMSDIRSVVDELHRLHDAGFGLAVDDFGTGYSSLSYLQRFPVDVLKVDSSFVQHVETDADSRALCASIIAMGHSLGLSVVGEGVETRWQQAFLEREGCDVLQGFLTGRPLPPCDFERLLRDRRAARVCERTPALSVIG